MVVWGTKRPCMAALAGEQTQVGQVRRQVRLLKSGLRVSEKLSTAKSLILHAAFLSAIRAELDLSRCHQDAMTFPQ